jgi:hypothetical protein
LETKKTYLLGEPPTSFGCTIVANIFPVKREMKQINQAITAGPPITSLCTNDRFRQKHGEAFKLKSQGRGTDFLCLTNGV